MFLAENSRFEAFDWDLGLSRCTVGERIGRMVERAFWEAVQEGAVGEQARLLRTPP